MTGHEFHRTVVEPAAGASPGWLVDGRPVGFGQHPARQVTWTCTGPGHPRLAQRFADAVHAFAGSAQHHQPMNDDPEPMTGHDLHHHGDHDLGAGLVDLAVNVRVSATPPWLAAVITDTVEHLAGYPRPDEAVQAIAAAHGLSPAQEACRRPAGPKPSRCSPEPLDLSIRCGHPPAVHGAGGGADRGRDDPIRRVLLTPASGFTLDLADISRRRRSDDGRQPDQPDERRCTRPPLRELIRPGTDGRGRRGVHGCGAGADRVAVGARAMPGLIVLRRLTKTWGLAGLRPARCSGTGDIAEMRAPQPRGRCPRPRWPPPRRA